MTVTLQDVVTAPMEMLGKRTGMFKFHGYISICDIFYPWSNY
jgi:hypothetical protein